MNESERSGLASMRDCWITGGVAAALAPAAWQEMVAGVAPDEREGLLLAVAGQAFEVAFRPAAPKTLAERTPLPVLALPNLPQPIRPLLRSALKNSGDARGRLRVVGLVASRGFVAHPLDWMPAASELEAPAVYAPWVDWQGAAGQGGPAPETLDAGSWDDFFPAARRVLLAEMRRTDPAAARALIEAKAASEPAETRLSLVELLRTGLSADDAPYLESLAGDRSGKVRQLAAQFLARVGRSSSGDEADAAELAGLIEQSRAGLIRRRTVYAPAKLKSTAQQQRRGELFETCPLLALAATFGATESEFIAGWQLGVDEQVDRQLARMVAASGSEEAASQLGERLATGGFLPPLLTLLPRLGEAAQLGAVRLVLAGEPRFLQWLDGSVEIAPGCLDHSEIMAGRAYRQVRIAIAGSDEGEQRSARMHLPVFGFLADAEAAQAILSDLVAAGLAPADPALSLLRLNAALTARPGERA